MNHMPEIFVNVKPPAIHGPDARGVLAAVLEGLQAQPHEGSRLFYTGHANEAAHSGLRCERCGGHREHRHGTSARKLDMDPGEGRPPPAAPVA